MWVAGALIAAGLLGLTASGPDRGADTSARDGTCRTVYVITPLPYEPGATVCTPVAQ
jgi:hypothetical protein